MKTLPTYLLPLLFVFLINGLHSQDYSENHLSIEHLYTINKEWANHLQASPDVQVKFSSDDERIKYHLELVIKELKINVSDEFSKESLTNRNILLDKLSNYAIHQQFPYNSYHHVRRPYFIDNHSVHCAVGYLMKVSGNEELALQISEDHNYDYIKDITTPGILEWARKFGFTMDELKWIQPSYVPNTTVSQIGNSTNGEITKFHSQNPYDKLFFAGNFTTLDSLPCLNIGYYEDNQLSCFGGGLPGVINDLDRVNGWDIGVAGNLLHNNETYPLAVFIDDEWVYYSIPDRQGATGVALSHQGSGYSINLAISHPSIPGRQEIWHFLNSLEWVKVATVFGEINEISGNYGAIYAGHFDTVVIEGNLPDTITNVNNVIIKPFNENWHGVSEEICDNVKSILRVGETIYFGGEASIQEGSSHILLSRYLNNTLQPLITTEGFYIPDTVVWSINTIEFDNSQNLLLGGVYWRLGMGIIGRNLLKYNLITDTSEMLALFNDAVNAVILWDNHIYMGGNFTENGYEQPIHFLARIENPTSVSDIENPQNIVVFPNPFSNEISIEGLIVETEFQLFSSSGSVVKTGKTKGKIKDLNHLPIGIYFLELQGEINQMIRVVKTDL